MPCANIWAAMTFLIHLSSIFCITHNSFEFPAEIARSIRSLTDEGEFNKDKIRTPPNDADR